MERTKDYKIFKHITGNRDIYESHVVKLREAIQHKNLLPYIPLLCNDKMEVIDGQHRLEAAKAEGLEVTYIVIPGLKLEDVMSLNTHTKGWGINDFVDAWIKVGKTDYQVLKDFSAQYNITTHTAAGILNSGPQISGKEVSPNVHNGTFTANYLEYGKSLIENINMLKQYCEFNPTTDRTFLRAIAKIQTSPAFDFDELLSKLKLGSLRIEPRHNVRYYILELEDLYNWHNRYRIDLYSTSQVQ